VDNTRKTGVAEVLQTRDEGPYTQKLFQTERTIVMAVCLAPGQWIPPHSHENREAFVHCLEGEVRFTPGEGPAEIAAGELRFYDGAAEISPRNVGPGIASFLVTLVRKRDS
jgi:quercetin dioxygenase-like cupin family protein